MKMNKIKFRAKANIDNEWKYASNIHKVILDDTNEELWVIHPKGEKIEHLGDGYIKYRPLVVDKETIGQYTGLKDKEGKEVYINDILKITLENTREIFICLSDYKEFITNSIYSAYHEIKVIGNIHENKELLKC